MTVKRVIKKSKTLTAFFQVYTLIFETGGYTTNWTNEREYRSNGLPNNQVCLFWRLALDYYLNSKYVYTLVSILRDDNSKQRIIRKYLYCFLVPQIFKKNAIKKTEFNPDI